MNDTRRSGDEFWRSRFGVGLTVLSGVAAALLFSEHRVHALGALPYLLLLLCPLLHLFMHGGHEHRAHRSGDSRGETTDDRPER